MVFFAANDSDLPHDSYFPRKLLPTLKNRFAARSFSDNIIADKFLNSIRNRSALNLTATQFSNCKSHQKNLENASRLYASLHSGNAVLSVLPLVLIPVKLSDPEHREPSFGYSSSSIHWLGAIQMGAPNLPARDLRVLQLTLNIAHESGHQLLFAYHHGDSLITSGYSSPIYSCIRRMERPALHSFHALVASLMMQACIRDLSIQLEMTAKQSAWIRQQEEALHTHYQRSLRSFRAVQFTPFGKLLFDECATWGRA